MQKTTLQYTKSTKRTHVYSTEEEGAAIKTVYIQGESLPKKAPTQITLTIEYDDE